MTQKTDFIDVNGLTHHLPDPTEDTSENEILFTSVHRTLGMLTYGRNPWPHYFNLCEFLRKEIQNNKRVSHDNYTGYICLRALLKRFKIKLPDNDLGVQVFSSQRPHPRDVIFYAKAKCGLFLYFSWIALTVFVGNYIETKLGLIPCLIWLVFSWLIYVFPSIAMIISCLRDYKKRGDQVFIHTDGKILTFLRCQALDMEITFAICDFIIRKKKTNFGSWTRVFKTYYQHPEHPINKLIKTWELWRE